MIHALAAKTAKGKLERHDFDPGPLGDEHVEIAVEYCGVCHSDLSMLDNDWGMAKFPFVPGHEVVGKITAVGENVKTLKPGDRVGLGWTAESCMHCNQCLGGDQNLCPKAKGTIVGRAGGFADAVRCHWAWAFVLPEALDPAKVGPLFCGGITVFGPFVQFDVKPTDRVAVIGIGGLGHMALMFARKWGCDVTAFTSTDAKAEESKRLGAHHVISSRDASALKKAAGSFDLILSTVNVSLDWKSYIAALAPRGRLHMVGAVLEPMAVPAFSLISAQKEISGSPTGAPVTIKKMVEFCARHGIAPMTEEFPMSRANEALDHVRAGKARYRAVLKQDLA